MKEIHIKKDRVGKSRCSKGCNQSLPTRNIIYPKLELTTPGDIHEQEADRVADFVMRKSSSGLGSEQPSTTSIFPPTISRNSSSTGGVAIGASTESGINASRGSGQPMPSALLARMESGFGQDFSAVRLHTGSNAVQMNRDLGAKAFTYGNDIYFNSGQYQPHSHQGQRLLAHELTHVVQQNGKVGRSLFFESHHIYDAHYGRVPESFNSVEINTLKNDFRLAKKMINKCIEVLSKIKDNKASKSEEDSFISWFGVSALPQNNGVLFERIIKYYNKLGRFENHRWICYKDTTSKNSKNAIAYAYCFDNINAIFFTNFYFAMRKTKRASTIIHEMSHDRAYTNSPSRELKVSLSQSSNQGNTYRYEKEYYEYRVIDNPLTAEELAKINSRYASRNAANYQGFAKALNI